MSEETDLPLIPLSELRVVYQKAVLYLTQGNLDYKQLARLMVAVEVNSRLANEWYSRVEQARNYQEISGAPCPLCVWAEGERVAACNYHRQIEQLQLERSRLRQTLSAVASSILTFCLENSLGELETYAQTTQADEDGESEPASAAPAHGTESIVVVGGGEAG